MLHLQITLLVLLMDFGLQQLLSVRAELIRPWPSLPAEGSFGR